MLSEKLQSMGKKCIYGTRAGIMIFLLVMILFPVHSRAADPARVLLISSYHPAFPTFFQQIDGIKSVFGGRPVLLDVEFMDSKRFNDPVNLRNFYLSLSYKLSRMDDYAAIMAADDNALSFVMAHRKELFHDKPLVFFGINDTERASELVRSSGVRGVVEAVSMKETIDLMIRFHPGVRNIVALVDFTPSGQADLKTFYQASRDYASLSFSEISLGDASFEAFAKQLNRLDAQSAAILLSAYRDKDGRVLQFHEVIKLIRDNTSVPLYHLWEHGLGEGIVGGKVVSHYQQGRAAAKQVLQILNDRSEESGSLIKDEANQYVFDYKELKRFDIPLSLLPKASEIIDWPDSFYSRYKRGIWTIAGIFGFLLLMLAVMGRNIMLRKQAERKLQQEHHKLEIEVQRRTDSLRKSNEQLQRENQDRILAEAALRKERDFAESLVNTAQVIILLLDNDGRIVRFNPYMETLTGCRLDDVKGRDWFSTFVAERDRSVTREFFTNALNDIPTRSNVTSIVTKKGKERIVEWCDMALRDADGKTIGLLSIGQDITRTRELQELLVRSERLAATGQLAASIAHEINSPLQGITSLLSLMRGSHKDDPNLLSNIDLLKGAFEQIRNTVKNLLDLTRPGKEKKQPLNINHVIQGTIDLMNNYFKKNRISIHLELSSEIPLIYASPQQLGQVIMNLSNNAVEAMTSASESGVAEQSREGGEITFATVLNNNELIIQVRDNGPGIAEKDLPHLFDAFFTRKKRMGMGVGLSVCHGIIEEYDGRITAKNHSDGGAVFTIALPVLKSDSEN